MLFFYNLFVRLYAVLIRLAACWNKKAEAWIKGRRDVFTQLQKNISGSDKVIWMHCSSAGEFEQGKPLIERLKTAYPTRKVLVSFFSPSGYAVAKTYSHADFITYLPIDTRKNAERFFQIIKPELIIFVKYEFWYHHLSTAAFHHVPILLISAVFRQEQIFFKRHGVFFKQILCLFRHIFVQEQASLKLLQANGITHCSISGDTRFDRVAEMANKTDLVPFISHFVAGKKVIVAGSTWPGDEDVLAQLLNQSGDVKLIVAPHEISPAHIVNLHRLFPDSFRYSWLQKEEQLFPLPNRSGPHWVSLQKEEAQKLNEQLLQQANVLIIDSVGLLSRLYAYASITYVGGGFTRDGIHNILEAAAWGKPVLFGPNYKKYREGKEMIEAGGAFSFSTANELIKMTGDLLLNQDRLQSTGMCARQYITENTGATRIIMKTIQEKRLLTN